MLRERRRQASYKPNRRLDRKSSRGMIYENEELRLRTININAEVERGQSDNRKLRRENEQLRRELWSVRGECHRLKKKLKTIKVLDTSSNTNNNDNNSEESDTCDECQSSQDHDQDDDYDDHYYHHHDDCTDPDNCDCEGTDEMECQEMIADSYDNYQKLKGNICCDTDIGVPTLTKQRDHFHVNFDHLSIVSEENFTNSECASMVHCDGDNVTLTDDNSVEPQVNRHLSPLLLTEAGASGIQRNISVPLTPIELVANQLNDLQTKIPPLSYFENVIAEYHMTPSLGFLDNYSTSTSTTTTTTGETVIPVNGWDFNIQSPFVSRKLSTAPLPPPPPLAASMSNQHSQLPSTSISSTSTISSSTPTSSPQHTIISNSNKKTNRSNPAIADVPMSGSNLQNIGKQQKSPKHFFSPIKPRLRCDAYLSPISPTMHLNENVPSSPIHPPQEHLGPDIFVANALGSPYFHQPIRLTESSTTGPTSTPATTTTTTEAETPYIGSTSSLRNDPIYATVHKDNINQKLRSNSPVSNKTTSENLEELLNSIETLSEDILQMQLEKQNLSKSQEGLMTENESAEKFASSNGLSKNRKPYRSEMNLLLSYNGANNPVITSLEKSASMENAIRTSSPQNQISTTSLSPLPSSIISGSENALSSSPPPPLAPTPPPINPLTNRASASNSNGDSYLNQINDTPPPNMPDPMMPLPENRSYLGFDNYVQPPMKTMIGDNSVPMTAGGLSYLQTRKSPFGLSLNLMHNYPIDDGEIGLLSSNKSLNQQQTLKLLPLDYSNNDANVKLPHLTSQLKLFHPLTASSPDLTSPTTSSRSPKTVRRKLFGNYCQRNEAHSIKTDEVINAASSHTSTGHVNLNPILLPPSANATISNKLSRTESSASENANCESSSGSEATKQKTRRVSILFRDRKLNEKDKDNKDVRKNEKAIGNICNGGGSNSDLENTQGGSTIGSLKAASVIAGSSPHLAHSTPNSPHSGRRRNSTALKDSSSSNHHGHGHHHHHHHHQYSRKLSQESGRVGTHQSTSSVVAAAANAAHRPKSSRRHSEGTVASMPVGGIRTSIAGGSDFHILHHHFDSYHDGATSISDRNSNSLASSRESSTSLSMRSTRRKLSVSSHTGGKIPWCGCWGNGCL